MNLTASAIVALNSRPGIIARTVSFIRVISSLLSASAQFPTSSAKRIMQSRDLYLQLPHFFDDNDGAL